MDHTFVSALVLLLLVLDPFGSLPIFISVLKSVAPERLWTWMGALTVAMAVSGIVLLAADRIRKLLGASMVAAIEKLMGLVLTAIAVEMILAGLKQYFFSAP
jgi:small neutral amino acid transporter SnatA (MarC family)